MLHDEADLNKEHLKLGRNDERRIGTMGQGGL